MSATRPNGTPSTPGAPSGAELLTRTAAQAADVPRDPIPFIARWDLDKTYLRTDFDTARDLIRTAFERPDQKRTVPGAAALLRELGRAGVETHILSGSPEQLRSRIEEKLRLDGAKWASLTLKPNLENLVRLRFRAIRGQLGYKLPALLKRRCELRNQRDQHGNTIREVLVGDDAEADAFVYSLYADVCAKRVTPDVLSEVLRLGGAYEDGIRDAVRFASYIESGEVVERILIHLDRQSSPTEFRAYGPRVVPFYNYLQAAVVLFEDGRLTAKSVLNVAAELVLAHNFDASSLARSYADLLRRGHIAGLGKALLLHGLHERIRVKRPAASELVAFLAAIPSAADAQPAVEAADPEAISPRGTGVLPVGQAAPVPNIPYVEMVKGHNTRRRR